MSKWTKEYVKEYDRERYQRIKEQRVAQCKARRHETSKWMAELKATLKCSKCPENHPACLHFHHLKDKDLEVGNMTAAGWSKKRILAEIEKCIVLCGNCHAKLHYEEKVCMES